MTPSQNCYDLAKRFEGLRTTAYQDSVGVWTIGYGHTGEDVQAGLTITEAQAEELLISDMGQKAAGCVNNAVHSPISQNQFDALCDFTFNLGCEAFKESHLLIYVNAMCFHQAALEFPKWDHANGVVLPGLYTRRLAEQSLFLDQETA